MKTSDCLINKPKVIPRPVDQSKSIEPPAKRNRVDENVVNRSSTVRVANTRATQATSVTSQLRKPVRIAKVTQGASQSNKAAQITTQSNKMAQITSQLNKNTEVTLMSALSENLKNVSKISPEVTVKKVVSKVTESSTSMTMKNSEKVTIRLVDEMTKANGSRDKIFAHRIDEHPRQYNVPRRTEDTLKRAMPKNRSGLDKTIDVLRNRIASPENKTIPMKNLQRRKSMGAMVLIPKLRICPQSTEAPKSIELSKRHQHSKPKELQKSNAQEFNGSNQNEKIAAKPILMRRKTFFDEDLLSNKPRNEIVVISRDSEPEPQSQSNVTLPVSEGIVTRSRRSAGNLARTVNIFSCDECSYTSEVRTNWQRHKLIHSGIKPFQCQYCSKGFTQKTNLKSHMKSNHYDLHGNPDYWL